ncbi:ScpA family protein [uncultured Mitsuokella sp.]|uniref:segregation and condensation protein A n=1 Tax=uncultured Mitsuokella sp. TaxID=453120 RepID=UPI0026DBB5E2|nr:segregation/condensation protein A [uncultured Mitsuokella sp.]
MKDYTIHLPVFDGPLELLLHLIEKNKIDIYDIPIALLTREYLDSLETMKRMDMEVTSAFLVMAATLLQIKSRMMLPKPVHEETGEEEDPRLELVERLLEYKKFKQVSEVLGDMAVVQERFVGRAPLPLPVHRLPPEHLPLEELVAAFQSVLAVKVEPTIPAVLVAPETYSLEEKMGTLLTLLAKRHGAVRFTEAFRPGARGELIVTFLALLELMKKGLVTVRQPHLFADMEIALRQGAEQADGRNDRHRRDGQAGQDEQAGQDAQNREEFLHGTT